MSFNWNILIVYFLFFSTKNFAQYLDAPKFHVHQWVDDQDFEAAKDTIRAVSKWLCETPISWQYERRSSANVYVLNWMTNHPTRKWDLKTDCFGPLNDHLELMYTFLHASLYFSLVHERSSVMAREVYVLQMVVNKILWSEKYKGEHEWQEMVKSVQRGREKKYLMQCYGKTKQPVG